MMKQVKLDIVTGFLGAGKTTFINKILEGLIDKDFTVILENEFGEISVDAMSFDSSLVDVKEINSGCICCTFQGDFQSALEGIYDEYKPDRIIIEPSGIAHMSQVIDVLNEFLSRGDRPGYINIKSVVVDILNYQMYKENFTDFYTDQVENASSIVLSKAQFAGKDTIEKVVQDIRALNSQGVILTQVWDELSVLEILKFVENSRDLSKDIHKELEVVKKGKNINFEQWSGIIENKVSSNKLEEFIDLLKKSHDNDNDNNNENKNFGVVLRAKGIVKTDSGKTIKFDYIPGYCWEEELDQEIDPGRINVIGIDLNKDSMEDFWRVEAKD